MRIGVPAVAAAMLLAAAAQGGAQELPVLGQGNVPCSSWLERRAGNTAQADTLIAWVLGYITAFNEYASDPQPDVSAGEETEVLTGWIDDYCRENATANLYQASASLVAQLRQASPQ